MIKWKQICGGTMNALSIIIPSYNEEAVLELTYRELTKELLKLNRPYEILFIDDGSKDRTLEIIRTLAKDDSCVGGISLSRNFGKEGVLKAGLAAAKGDLIVVMDADLQDPPSLLSEMIRLIEEEGFDQVGTYRLSRKSQGIMTRLFSEAYYRTYNFYSDVKIPINEREYRMMSRKVVETLLKFSEQNRYIKSLWSWVGFKTTHIGYEDIDRAAGKTKYNIRNKLKLAKHNIMAASDRPLKMVSMFTLWYWIGLIILVIYQLLSSTLNAYLLWFGLIGIQFIILSVIADYVGKTYLEAKQRPNFIISEVIESELKKA
jgi:glycosyltransferase involved in cell wall biosynthesis